VPHSPRKAHWNFTYRAQIGGVRALPILKGILPYLGERRAAKCRHAIALVEDWAEDSFRGRPGAQRIPRGVVKEALIRALSGEVYGQIAADLGIAASTVSAIKNGQSIYYRDVAREIC